MPTPSFSNPRGDSLEGIMDHLIKLQRDLNYLLTNLDDLNINRLNARVIISETITTEKLKAGAVTAEKISVNELSAISANLGEVNAGRVTSSAEISVGTDAKIGNVLYLNETDGVNDKGIKIGTYADVDVQSGDLSLRTTGGNLLLNAAGNVYANGKKVPGAGISVSFNVMAADGISTLRLTFTDGVLTNVN